MESLGINIELLLIQVVVLAVVTGLPVISIFDLARKKTSGTPLALWVLVVCVVPVLGSLAYWIIKPTAEFRI